MKKIIISVIMLLVMVYMPVRVNAQTIDQNWVKSRETVRNFYKNNNRKLIEFDKNSLIQIEENNIAEVAVPDAVELLKQIAADNAPINNENPIKVFDILQKKFQDKKHYFQVATDISFHHSEKNPFLNARIIKGLKELLETTFDDNLKTFKTVFLYIKTPFIINSQNRQIKYGSEVIVIEVIAYIREYLRIAKSGKIEIKPEYVSIIKDAYNDLSLEQGVFSNLPGAKELISEY